jgi:hypothetical protein
MKGIEVETIAKSLAQRGCFGGDGKFRIAVDWTACRQMEEA